MALTYEQKQAVVEDVAAQAASAHSVIAAEYRGLTVEEMTQLRVNARNDNVFLKVAKNTLVKRAVEGTDYECISEGLTGPLLFAFSLEDAGGAARVMKDFAKEHDKLVVRMIAFGGQLLDASELDRLADLPTRDQALAMLLGVLQAPIGKFVRTLAEPQAKLVRTFAAVRDAKQN